MDELPSQERWLQENRLKLFFRFEGCFSTNPLLRRIQDCTVPATVISNTCFWLMLQDAQAYAYLLNVLAPEHCDPATLDAKDPLERAELVLCHAERMGCKRYLTAEEIVEGSPTLNLAFVAQIFHERFVLYMSMHLVLL